MHILVGCTLIRFNFFIKLLEYFINEIKKTKVVGRKNIFEELDFYFGFIIYSFWKKIISYNALDLRRCSIENNQMIYFDFINHWIEFSIFSTNEVHYSGVTLRFHSFIYHLIEYREVVKTWKYYRPPTLPRGVIRGAESAVIRKISSNDSSFPPAISLKRP
jgi:hypothetical protein